MLRQPDLRQPLQEQLATLIEEEENLGSPQPDEASQATAALATGLRSDAVEGTITLRPNLAGGGRP
jgi:hypothetical protein